MSYNVLSDSFFRPPFPPRFLTQTTYYLFKRTDSRGTKTVVQRVVCDLFSRRCSSSVIFFVPSAQKRCDIRYGLRFIVSLSSKIGVRVYLPYIDPRSFRSFDVSLLFRDTIIPKAKPKVTTAVTKAKAATTAAIITIGRTANVSE